MQMKNGVRFEHLGARVEASKHYPHLQEQWVEFLGEQPDEETTRVELGETAAA
jgi:hypothetical protein